MSMTLIELFPLFLAVGVAVISGAILTKHGFSNIWVWIVSLALGIAAWLLYVLTLKTLASWMQKRKGRNERQERDNRLYQDFNPDQEYPAKENLYYECLTCGNSIPSMSKSGVSCKCRNITIGAISHRPTIQNLDKVKLFSRK